MERDNPKVESDSEYLEFLEIVKNLEEELYLNTQKLNPNELLEVFPEAKDVIGTQIVEWQAKRKVLENKLKPLLIQVRSIKNEFSRWFWRQWLKESEGEKLLEIDGHISRLKYYLYLARGEPPKENSITDETIQRAKSIPIENILNQKMRKLGNKLLGLCPLHKEKHPSFYVYLKTNSFYCYGCGIGGDIINLIKLLHNLSFIESVKWLSKI